MKRKSLRPLAVLLTTAMVATSVPAYAYPANAADDAAAPEAVSLSEDAELSEVAAPEAESLPEAAEVTPDAEPAAETPQAEAETEIQQEEASTSDAQQTADKSLTPGSSKEKVAFDADQLADSDELAEGYIMSRFYGTSGIAPLANNHARDHLTGTNLAFYNILKPQIEEVAAGNRASTVITIEADTVLDQTNFSATELGVDSITATNAGQLAKELMDSYYSTDIIMDALVADMPYELYWFDKGRDGMITSYTYAYNDEVLIIYDFEFSFTVLPEYRGEDEYTVDTTKISRIDNAVSNAQSIISSTEEFESDTEILYYYRDVICNLTDYDHDAIVDPDNYGDPWQLVNVFDGDPSTKAVCEGYSKAFQFLMDNTSFEDPGLYSFIVSGYLTGEPHMWNIIDCGDGLKYIADITNSDSLSVEDQIRRFLQVPDYGDLDEGYVFYAEEIEDGDSVYTLPYTIYTYDDVTKSIYGDDLNLHMPDHGGADDDDDDDDDGGDSDYIDSGELALNQTMNLPVNYSDFYHKLTFTAPSTGEYIFYTDNQFEYDLDILPTAPEGSRENTYYLTEGETYDIWVNVYVAIDTIPVTVSKCSDISDIIIDLPEYVLQENLYLDASMTLVYEDGTTKTHNDFTMGNGFFDKISGQYVSLEFESVNDEPDPDTGYFSIRAAAYIDYASVIAEKTVPVIPVGETSIPVIPANTATTIPVSSLGDHNRVQFTASESGFYSFTIKGNMTSYVFMIPVPLNYDAGVIQNGILSDNGFVCTVFVEEGATLLFDVEVLSGDTSVTITSRKLLDVVDVQINAPDVIGQYDRLDVSIDLIYADDSTETITLDNYGVDYVEHSFSNKEGVILYSYMNVHNGSTTTSGSIHVLYANDRYSKDIIVLPDTDYKNNNAGKVTLTQLDQPITLPNIEEEGHYYFELTSELTGIFQLNHDCFQLSSSIFEDGTELKTCHYLDNTGETGNLYSLEKGKKYLLFCYVYGPEEDDAPIDAQTISFSSPLIDLGLTGIPEIVTSPADLEDAEFQLIYGDGTIESYPLIVDGSCNPLLTNDLTHETIQITLEYTGEYSHFVNPALLAAPDFVLSDVECLNRGALYELKLGTLIADSWVGTSVCFELSDLDACGITADPEDVTAGLKTPVSFHVEANRAVSYQWQYSKNGTSWTNSSTSSAKTDTVSITVSKSNYMNLYRCKVVLEDGTTEYSEPAVIDLIPWVNITAQPESPAMTLGETVNFHVEAENVAEGGYQWQYSKDGGASWYKSGVTGSNTDTLSIKVSKTNAQNIYRCQLTGIDGNAVKSNSAGFVIIEAQPQPSAAPVGTKATFSLKATGVTAYQWQYSDDGVKWYKSTATGATTDTITFTSTSKRNRVYRCVLTTETGITAYTKPVGYVEGINVTAQPQSISATSGQKVTFTVTATGVSSYQWQYSKDGKTWTNSTAASAKTASLSTTAQTSYSGRQYRCVMTDASGSKVISNAATLTVS